jgi:hypothetical protein
MVEHGAMLTGVNHRRLEFLRSLAQGDSPSQPPETCSGADFVDKIAVH